MGEKMNHLQSYKQFLQHPHSLSYLISKYQPQSMNQVNFDLSQPLLSFYSKINEYIVFSSNKQLFTQLQEPSVRFPEDLLPIQLQRVLINLNGQVYNQIIEMISQAKEKEKVASSRKGCKYAKIPLASKIRLFRGVVQDGLPIKRIAQILNIKYSTAKTLVRQFKDEQIDLDWQAPEHETREPSEKTHGLTRCGYRVLSDPKDASQPSGNRPPDTNDPCNSSENPSGELYDVLGSQFSRVEIVSKLPSATMIYQCFNSMEMRWRFKKLMLPFHLIQPWSAIQDEKQQRIALSVLKVSLCDAVVQTNSPLNTYYMFYIQQSLKSIRLKNTREMIDGVEINQISKDDYSRRFQLLSLLIRRKIEQGVQIGEEQRWSRIEEELQNLEDLANEKNTASIRKSQNILLHLNQLNQRLKSNIPKAKKIQSQYEFELLKRWKSVLQLKKTNQQQTKRQKDEKSRSNKNLMFLSAELMKKERTSVIQIMTVRNRLIQAKEKIGKAMQLHQKHCQKSISELERQILNVRQKIEGQIDKFRSNLLQEQKRIEQGINVKAENLKSKLDQQIKQRQTNSKALKQVIISLRQKICHN